MHKEKRSLSCVLNFPVALIAVLLCASFAWAGPGERTIYEFPGGSSGLEPFGTMIFDKTGSLYGLAAGGGANNAGAVFKLTPSETGSWTESVIYSFLSYPDYPALAFDSTGNLYGTLAGGGGNGCGIIYQLVPGSEGWTENTVFSFNGTTNGCVPTGLVFDTATGSLFGVASEGGAYNGGIAFALTPVEGGGWNFSVIHSFGFGTDGSYPVASPTLDASGNLYGTTYYGGSYSDGTVFRITYGTDGWSESVLYNFTGGDNGYASAAGVIFDRHGNLYGTTDEPGGGDDVGNVYKLTPTKGDWAIHVIHTFTGGPDGGNPSGYNLAIDGAGNLYGMTYVGGLYNYGTAYKLSPSTGGKWTETVLHAFTNGDDGGYPYSGMVLNSSGNLFGTTGAGGAYGDGVVFEVRP